MKEVCPLSVCLHCHWASAVHSDTGAMAVVVAVGCRGVEGVPGSVQALGSSSLHTRTHFFVVPLLPFLCYGAAAALSFTFIQRVRVQVRGETWAGLSLTKGGSKEHETPAGGGGGGGWVLSV